MGGWRKAGVTGSERSVQENFWSSEHYWQIKSRQTQVPKDLLLSPIKSESFVHFQIGASLPTMSMWVAVFCSLLCLPVETGSNNSSMFKTFVLKLEEFARLDAEQALVISEYSNTIEALTSTIEVLNATVQEHETNIDDNKADIQALQKQEGIVFFFLRDKHKYLWLKTIKITTLPFPYSCLSCFTEWTQQHYCGDHCQVQHCETEQGQWVSSICWFVDEPRVVEISCAANSEISMTADPMLLWTASLTALQCTSEIWHG